MLASSDIKVKALELGFDACGIAPAGGLPELRAFDTWIARGFAGEMKWLARSAAARADATGAMPSARSVIVTATLYNTDRPYATATADPARARVSRYAWGDDYHPIIMQRLDALVGWMHAAWPETFEACPYVDMGPVQERAYARHAGIGWIGKNCCVISPELGSWIFLGVILCSLPLAPDEPAFDRCASCTRCLEACPTQAFVAPGVLDARRCISYLTIEQRGPIPDGLRGGVGRWVYGCDACQEVCPFNGAAPVSGDPAWQPRAAWDGVDLESLARRSDDELRAAMKGSAMKRAGVKGLRRNIESARNAPAGMPARNARSSVAGDGISEQGWGSARSKEG